MKKIVFASIALGVLASLAPAQGMNSRSWYSRLGIHKIAAAVDMAVEKHMTNPILAANPRVQMAFKGLQLPAIKFSVTAQTARLLGGPQKVNMDSYAVAKWFNLNRTEKMEFHKGTYEAFRGVGLDSDEAEMLADMVDMAIGKSKSISELPSAEMFDNPTTLYARLGGIVPITMVIDSFANKLVTDPVITANKNVVMSLTKGKATAAGIKYLVSEQVAAAAGGPYKYTGVEMKKSHKNLMISEEEWAVGGRIMKEVLDMYKVPAKEQGEIFALLGSTKKDIVKP